ncbi:MAG: isoprenylcysteine carboxylmethyltransferase family protein [Chloroflexota bacterium]
MTQQSHTTVQEIPPSKNLILQTLRTFVIGATALGLLIFIPAWTINYWQAWVFIVVFMISVNIVGLYLALKDPALLERRKKVGPTTETSPAQKIIMSIAIFSILGLLVFSALDHRFGWSPVSPVVSVVGDVLVALGLFLNLLVFKENSFGGSTVEKFEGQKVISSGPYSFVRHPMYVGVMVMVMGVPLALGNWWGLAILLIMLPVLAWRILDEEKMLKQELAGYTEYMQKVKFRIMPYVW